MLNVVIFNHDLKTIFKFSSEYYIDGWYYKIMYRLYCIEISFGNTY